MGFCGEGRQSNRCAGQARLGLRAQALPWPIFSTFTQGLAKQSRRAGEAPNRCDKLADMISTKLPEPLPDVPAAHQAELERRWAEHRLRPDDVVPWEEVKAKLLKQA
jgi:putative addiction module component (TIGR02574 family)